MNLNMVFKRTVLFWVSDRQKYQINADLIDFKPISQIFSYCNLLINISFHLNQRKFGEPLNVMMLFLLSWIIR